MMFTHDDIQQRLVDFLYGELTGDERAAFDAHLIGCDACRADVAAFQGTRTAVRAVVRAPLQQPVPPAVRARVLEAAARATAAAPAATSTVAATTLATERPFGAGGGRDEGAVRPSRWLAWLRARWTVPMFATVAAMGALLLVRETIFREAARPLGESAQVEAPTTTPSVPLPATGQAGQDEAPRQGKGTDTEAKAEAQLSAPDFGSAGAVANRAGPRRDGTLGGASAAEPRSKVGPPVNRRRAAARPVVAAAPKASMDSLDSLDDGAPLGRAQADARLAKGSEKATPPRPAAAPAKAPAPSAPSPDKFAGAQGAPGGFAQPPPPAAAPSAAANARGSSDRLEGRAATTRESERSANASATASAGEMDTGKKKGTKAKDAPDVSKQELAAPAAPGPAAFAAAPADAVAGDAKLADDARTLGDRAGRAMAARDWATAITTYRDLLRRFPRHASAATWRRRLAAAQVAQATDQRSQPSGFATPPPPR